MTEEKDGSKSLSPLIELESLFYNYPVPSLISLYRGRPGVRKEVLNSLNKKLEQEGFLAVNFNARKHFSNQDLSGALLENLLVDLRKVAVNDSEIIEEIEELSNMLASVSANEGPLAHRLEAMSEFDLAMKNVTGKIIDKHPVVVLVQGLDTLGGGVLVELIEFMSCFLDNSNCAFVVSISEKVLEGDLKRNYGDELHFSPIEYIEETFQKIVVVPEEENWSKIDDNEFVTASERIYKIYSSPEHRAKLDKLRIVQPNLFDEINENPASLISLEKLLRGDNSVALQQEVAASDILRTAREDSNVRAVLLRKPFFYSFSVEPAAEKISTPGEGVVSLDEGPDFETSGLVMESGAEISARRKRAKKVVKTRVRKGKKIVKKRAKAMSKVKSKKENTLDDYLEPVKGGDTFASRELWKEVPKLNEREIHDLLHKLVEYTNERNARVRASAALAISAVAQSIARKVDDQTVDALLVLTSDGVKEVREAAAEALSVATKFGQGREKIVREGAVYKAGRPRRSVIAKPQDEVVVEPVVVAEDEDVSDAVVVVAEVEEEEVVVAAIVEEEDKPVQVVKPVVLTEEEDDIDDFFT